MMMPANYSAIAESEMTYVVGGGVQVGSLPGITSTLTSNILTIVGNSFIKPVISSTLGVLFGGKYTFGSVTTGIASGVKADYTEVAGDTFGSKVNGVLNAGLQIVGGLAAIAQLAVVDVKPAANATLTIAG